MSHQVRGWAVFDRNRQYIAITYPTEERAQEERMQLLRHFDPSSEWFERLNVRTVGCQPLVQPGDPPYGYRHRRGRRGCQLLEHPTEQKIIWMAGEMRQQGERPGDIVRRLNAGNYRNRQGGRFTTLQINQLIQGPLRRPKI